MSNLIKYPFTPNLSEKDVYIVDTQEKEKFTSINNKLKDRKIKEQEAEKKNFVSGMPIRNDMKILE
ncbi:MAG: hypothetical protein LBR68_04095, partial [Lachnoclostridium sp.]|nr:hypothetical protein [Lachnoclostridium sp.]